MINENGEKQDISILQKKFFEFLVQTNPSVTDIDYEHKYYLMLGRSYTSVVPGNVPGTSIRATYAFTQRPELAIHVDKYLLPLLDILKEEIWTVPVRLLPSV